MTTRQSISKAAQEQLRFGADERQGIKCIIWDLDDTLWEGALLEDGARSLRPHAREVVGALDERGILQSVASKNDYDLAIARIAEFGLAEYFLYPQINWGSKVASVRTIQRHLNIGTETIAFVDDQAYEREEVHHSLPGVRCIDATDLASIPDMPEAMPRFVTEDSRLRRRLYQLDRVRSQVEESFLGPKEEFLATLNMELWIDQACEADLQRAQELTQRTHQLNSTGYTYSYDELDAMCRSPWHRVYIAALNDKFGPYGKIGLTVVECGPEAWKIKLLLMSCRVMTRGIGSTFLTFVRDQARRSGVRLLADFVHNNRNRMMFVAYKFAGFREIDTTDGITLLENDLKDIPTYPPYLTLHVEDY